VRPPRSSERPLATWDEDSPDLRRNLLGVAREIREGAARRDRASASLVKRWHALTMQGLEVDDPAWVGRLRGEEGVGAIEVRVRECRGAPSKRVAQDVARFIEAVQRALDGMDPLIPPGGIPTNADQLNAVIVLAARAHARWVEIHPFVNGNGRTARMWADWILVRYGVPAFVRLRPRPGTGEYEAAGRAALCHGEYEPTVVAFRAMYDRWQEDDSA